MKKLTKNTYPIEIWRAIFCSSCCILGNWMVGTVSATLA